jgi:hypothetical protein
MRLSIENAPRRTIRELERLQAWLTTKKQDVGPPKEMIRETVNVVLRFTILDDLLHDMHVITLKEKDDIDRVRNNIIEQLGHEFPDLVVKEKH